MSGITYTEALTMPDEILTVYIEESIAAQKRPWRIAQWLVMWLSAFHRAYKHPKKYDFFDPFKDSGSKNKMSKEERAALFDKWDKIKATGTKKISDTWP